MSFTTSQKLLFFYAPILFFGTGIVHSFTTLNLAANQGASFFVALSAQGRLGGLDGLVETEELAPGDLDLGHPDNTVLVKPDLRVVG